MQTPEATTGAIDLTEIISALVDRDVEVVEVITTAHQSSTDTETLVVKVRGQLVQATAPDLFDTIENLRVWLTSLLVDVVEARQAAIDAERHACPCGVLLDPDEEYCGAPACRAYLQAEHRAEAFI